jgi:hypothetical protein
MLARNKNTESPKILQRTKSDTTGETPAVPDEAKTA